MEVELTEAVWLEERTGFTLHELAQRSGLTENELRDLVELGALEPLDVTAHEWTFGAQCMVAAKAACRLRNDFELEAPALAVVLSLLERVHELEAEVQRLHAKLPRVLKQR